MFIYTVITIIISIVVTFLLLEGIFRFLPVCGDLKIAPLNNENPIPRWTPDRTITWSKGWNFSIVNKIRINNYGFVNNQDYDKNLKTQLLTVIGDSYVEAAMVPYDETLHGRLAHFVGNKGRIYSMGISGSPLSNYLIYAELAKEEFNSNGMVFVIIANDYDESYYKYRLSPQHYYFIESPEGGLILTREDWEPGILRTLISRSQLMLYFFRNLGGAERIKQVLKGFMGGQRYVANVSITMDEERLEVSKKVVDAFFEELPIRSGLDTSQILFVVDGIRSAIYNPETKSEVEQSYAYWMNSYFIDKAISLGYEVINMHEVFEKHYRIKNQRFEYPTDWHWNGLGHEVVANAIIKSNVFNKIFSTD